MFTRPPSIPVDEQQEMGRRMGEKSRCRMTHRDRRHAQSPGHSAGQVLPSRAVLMSMEYVAQFVASLTSLIRSLQAPIVTRNLPAGSLRARAGGRVRHAQGRGSAVDGQRKRRGKPCMVGLRRACQPKRPFCQLVRALKHAPRHNRNRSALFLRGGASAFKSFVLCTRERTCFPINPCTIDAIKIRHRDLAKCRCGT